MADVTPAAAGSVVPLRPLGVAELLDSAVRLVRHNARASFSLAFPFALVRAATVAALLYWTAGSGGAVTAQLLLPLFASGVLGTILAGVLAPVYTSAVLGRRVGAQQALRTVRSHPFALAGLGAVVAIAQELGVVLLYVGGAFLWGIWAVAAPALVVEGLGVRRALSRSYELVRTEFWRTWGIRALRWVLTTVLRTLLIIPFTVLAELLSGTDLLAGNGRTLQNPGIYVSILAVGTLVMFTVITPISAAVDSLLYTDLRMRREGMDLMLGMPPVGGGVAPDRPAQPAW